MPLLTYETTSLHPTDPTLYAITPSQTLFPIHNLHSPVFSSFLVSKLIFSLCLTHHSF